MQSPFSLTEEERVIYTYLYVYIYNFKLGDEENPLFIFFNIVLSRMSLFA